MKTIAFYIEDGEWKIIGAKELDKRRKHDPHSWEGREYYSTNSVPERRLKMHLKRKSTSLFFAFNPDQDEDYKRLGEGESLGHYMYKMAISELKKTTLKLIGKGIDFQIEVTSAEVEKCIQLEDRKYFIDVFLTFESKSAYRTRWNGCVGIEVHNTNAVDSIKKSDMEALDIPIVEVEVRGSMLGRGWIDEETATNESVRKQIDWMKEKFAKNIWVKVLSDPESDEFSKNENYKLRKQLKEKMDVIETFKNRCRDDGLISVKKDQEIEQLGAQLHQERTQRKSLYLEMKDINQQLQEVKNMSVTTFIKFKLFGS